MKIALFVFLILPIVCIGQSKSELHTIINQNEKKIESLNEEIKRIKKESRDLESYYQNEIRVRDSVLSEINEIWLKTPFENKYTSAYFLETGYSKLDKDERKRMAQSQLMARSFILSENSKSSLYFLAKKVYEFNASFQLLDSITTDVFEIRYDENNVNKAIRELN